MFIPADAGNYFSALVDCGTPLGLSPLARGTPVLKRRFSHIGRFIPAGAGNTTIHASATPALPVYPRWRGEHPFLLLMPNCWSGLSPLARGTHCESRGLQFPYRFIPAGAGNTPA
ncbi:hypothetical protein SEEOR701_19058 [Salmonella enterica subsp. enterica serovar Oranienburg str. 701]|nr:hypothetical protein SEEOR701_19058 [Salmonella enterica subsp. enterica serovar Oranienburg str. 701]